MHAVMASIRLPSPNSICRRGWIWKKIFLITAGGWISDLISEFRLAETRVPYEYSYRIRRIGKTIQKPG